MSFDRIDDEARLTCLQGEIDVDVYGLKNKDRVDIETSTPVGPILEADWQDLTERIPQLLGRVIQPWEHENGRVAHSIIAPPASPS